MSPVPVRVALLGCGVVGAEVVRLLRTQADDLAARVGAPLHLEAIAVRDAARDRGLGRDQCLVTSDAESVVSRGDIDVVVELMGGIEPARSLLLAAMANGASVVTANKALLAADGPSMYETAAEQEVDLYFEASVGGAIPLLRPLRESLAGDTVRRILGIVNGTCNFILTRMDETGVDMATALAEATELGYAEKSDPTADTSGADAAAKAAILASLAFHSRVTVDDVHCEGIENVTAEDVALATEMGYVIKSLAICELADDDRSVGVRVHPAMIPRTHPLANVREAYNAVFVESEAAGSLMFYGQGAGGAPTASAVLGDLVAVARHRRLGTRGVGESAYAQLPVRPVGSAVTRYHINLDVADRPGVLAHVAQVFASHDVSIRVVHQEGSGDDASLVLITHSARDDALTDVVAELAGLDIVRAVVGVMRVEGEES